MSERKQDETLNETSDAEKQDKPSHERGIEERPTGTPNSDRHATETAHHSEDEQKPSS